MLLLWVVSVALGTPVSPPAQTQPALQSQIQDQRERIARIEGTLESLKQQLETERTVAERTLSTVSDVVTYGSLVLGAAVTILGILGYRDIRQRSRDVLTKYLEDNLDAKLRALVEVRLAALEEKWDQRFAELANRSDRLLAPRRE